MTLSYTTLFYFDKRTHVPTPNLNKTPTCTRAMLLAVTVRAKYITLSPLVYQQSNSCQAQRARVQIISVNHPHSLCSIFITFLSRLCIFVNPISACPRQLCSIYAKLSLSLILISIASAAGRKSPSADRVEYTASQRIRKWDDGTKKRVIGSE